MVVLVTFLGSINYQKKKNESIFLLAINNWAGEFGMSQLGTLKFY